MLYSTKLIYYDDLNDYSKLWKGFVEDIQEITEKDYRKYSEQGIHIPHYLNYATIKICFKDKNKAVGVNGRSISVCGKPEINLFHIKNGDIYGFFYRSSHSLKVGSDIIFVPQVNVYEPNLIFPIMNNFYEIS